MLRINQTTLHAAVLLGLAVSLGLLKSSIAQSSLIPPVEVSISANDAIEVKLFQGWPLLVAASVLHREAFQDGITPITIVAPSGSWANAVQLLVRDQQGQTTSWPLHLAHTPPGSLTLDKQTGGQLGWWLSPEETMQIPLGGYQLLTVLDSTTYSNPGSGTPSARSEPARITILTAPGSLTPAQEAEKYLLLTNYDILRGDEQQALIRIDELLAKQPDNVEALALRGELLKEAGKLWEALDAYTHATEVFFAANPDPEEPPIFLLQTQNEILRQLDLATAFDVTVAPKVPLHPYIDKGHTEGYFIDGIPGRELYLFRGTTYTFRMVNVPTTDPFYLTTSPVGAGAEPYTEGVTGTPATGTQAVTLTPDENTPATLYYQSLTHEYMGWRLTMREQLPVSVEQKETPQALPRGYALSFAYPNPFNPQVRITLEVARQQRVTVKVFDVLGRQVGVLHDGVITAAVSHDFVFNAGNLPSSVYLIRVDGEVFTEVRKVLLLK